MSQGRFQPKPASRTHYYELLGVDQKATEQDLKKAYRKKALQLHPDKQGGDGEPFKQMKRAYDVLSDPKKRKAYDQYGDAAIKAMEGEMTVEVAMQMFVSIGMCERMLLVLLLTILVGYLLLFPILLSVRWDHPKSMSFAHVFIPVWIGLTLMLTCFLCCVPTPTFPDIEEEDETIRKEVEEMQQQQINYARMIRYGGALIVTVLFVVLLFLALRLDGETHWSYFLVIWPWILLELGLFAWKFWSAEASFVLSGHNPAILEQKKWMTKDWNFFVVSFTCPHVIHIAFACLVAYKMDGSSMSWWEVFIPFWVEFVLNSVLILSKCGSRKTAEEFAGMSMEDKMREDTSGSIVAKLMAQCMWTGCIVLLCFKLSHPNSLPAWIIFLPTFVIAGCFCCCASCFLCCMSPEMANMDDEEAETGFGPSSGSPTHAAYGTMGGSPYAPHAPAP